ncbi:MAG: pyridoxamine 5'-phosphate oxidase family protein [Anaerolineae bacterium]
MATPRVMRPSFPEGYVSNPKALLSWDQVVSRLIDAGNYWLCTVRPDGRPHAVPVWGVWVNDRLYYDGSSETRHARNLAQNSHIVVHLESGDQVVIVEGICAPAGKPSAELGTHLAREYARKYEGYAPEPASWDEGGLYEVTPRSAIAWTSFIDDPTKFVFEA